MYLVKLVVDLIIMIAYNVIPLYIELLLSMEYVHVNKATIQSLIQINVLVFIDLFIFI